MNPAPNLPVPPPPPAGTNPRPRRYTAVWSDGLGERLLVFDPTTASSLELLKFRKDFADAKDFEALLRKRVEDLRHLRHPSLSTVRSVDWLDGGDGLALVSQHVAGRRLSDILQHARGPAFALEFIRQVTPALFALQQVRPGFAHGVLTAERIVVTREGRLVLVETALAPAIEALRLPADRLRTELGLALPSATEPIGLDPRLDVVQLGFIALSLLLGRRLDPADFRSKIPALLDEFANAAASVAARLRPWLEGALQMTERPFESAQDALEAISDLPSDLRAEAEPPTRTVLTFRPPAEAAMPPAPIAPTPAVPAPSGPIAAARVEPVVAAPVKPIAAEPTAARTTEATHVPLPTEDEMKVRIGVSQATKPAGAAAVAMSSAPRSSRRFSTLQWVVTGLALAASVEGAAIAGLLKTSSPAVPNLTIAPPPMATTAPLRPITPGETSSAGTPFTATTSPVNAPAPPAPVAEPPAQKAETASPAAAATGKFGGVKISSPIDLQVFEGGTQIGSTAGPIALTEGAHALDVVNEALGFRGRQNVTVKPGQMASVTMTLPQGRVNINAAPWASVWIDGTSAGDTPLANVSLPIGTHEVLFRHPQLGEQRMTAVVKAEGVTRVSASFQR